MTKNLLIKNILKNQKGEQKLFTWFFNRTLELCSDAYLSKEMKIKFEKKLLNFNLANYLEYVDDFFKKKTKNNQIILFYALCLLNHAYQYCYRYGINEQTSLNMLLGVKTNNMNDICVVLDDLTNLEKISSDYKAGEHARYWVDKEQKKIRNQRAKGGHIRSKNYLDKMNPIFDQVFLCTRQK